MKIPLRSFLACVTAAVVFTGCAGYQLGSMLPPDIKTVYVPTFVNRTREPLLEVETTQAMITQLQRDGSLRVADEANADSLLEVVLRDYRIDPVSYQGDDRTSAREYRIVLTADITLRRRVDGSVVVNSRGVIGEGVFPFTGDLTSSKRRGLPVAAEDLAYKLVTKIVEVW